MSKFAQLVVFMEQVNNFDISFWDGHSIIPYRLGLILFLVAGLCSCGSLKVPDLKVNNFSIGSNVTPIREIQPKQDKKATVYIQGKVEKRVPLVKKWVYKINDSTDTIWVVTNESNFEEGTKVVIKGKVRYQSILLADQELGEVYIEED